MYNVCMYECVYAILDMMTFECEIDATVCSTSLTEESSGMGMDLMVSVPMMPDTLALEEGIG